MAVHKRIRGRSAAAIAASLERQLHADEGSGRSLPTVRALAARLGVSPATVASAYKLLRARGLVAGQGRRGTRVLAAQHLPAAARHTRAPASLIDLASGGPDPALLPPLEPALRMIDTSRATSGAGRADRALAAFATADLEADGLTAPGAAVMGSGLDAIEQILREYLRPGDRVGVEDPGSPAIVDLISTAAYVPAPFTVDEEGPRADAFEEALRAGSRAAIVTPRAQNPSGAAISGARAAQLERIVRRYPGLLLIHYDRAGVVAGAPLRILRGAPRAPWALVRPTSMFLGPDLCTTIAAGDETTVARVAARRALGVREVSPLLQRLTLALWSDPANGRRFARAAALYGARRQALRAALSARGIRSFGESGLNVWVPVPEESAVVHALAERGWAVAAGERFRRQTPPAVRITISTLDPLDAARLAGDLAAVLRPSPAAVA